MITSLAPLISALAVLVVLGCVTAVLWRWLGRPSATDMAVLMKVLILGTLLLVGGVGAVAVLR